MIGCPCGTLLPDDMLYCTNCGRQIRDDEQPTVVRPAATNSAAMFQVEQPSQFRTFAKWFAGSAAALAFGLVAVVALVAVGALLYVLNSPAMNQPPQTPPQPQPQPTREVVYITATPTPVPEKKRTPKPMIDMDELRAQHDRDERAANAANMVRSGRQCRIVGGRNGEVNLRQYCEERNCDTDESTIVGSVANGTIVYSSGNIAPLGRLRWTGVAVGSRPFWIAASKLSCVN